MDSQDRIVPAVSRGEGVGDTAVVVKGRGGVGEAEAREMRVARSRIVRGEGEYGNEELGWVR